MNQQHPDFLQSSCAYIAPVLFPVLTAADNVLLRAVLSLSFKLYLVYFSPKIGDEMVKSESVFLSPPRFCLTSLINYPQTKYPCPYAGVY